MQYGSAQMVKAKFMIGMAAGVLTTALAVAAMQWQLGRAHDKLERQSRWDAMRAAPPQSLDASRWRGEAPALPARLRLAGRFMPEATVFLDNRMQDGVAGVRVITAFEIAPDLPRVLVDRGFAPRDPRDRERLPFAPLPAAEHVIEGVAVAGSPRALELGALPNAVLGSRWQNLDYDRFETALGQPVSRFLVQLESDPGDGLQRHWPPPALGVDKHRGYAFQWGALAVLAAGLTLTFGIRHVRRS